MPRPKWLKVAVLLIPVLIWGVFESTGLSAPGKSSRLKLGTNYALIIGIGNYKNWPKLTSPTRDAERIAKVLTDNYNFRKSNITLLTDKAAEKPTLLNILTQIDQYTVKLGPDDNLLIFFSGHSTEDDQGETYWIPIDGKKNSKLTWLSHKSITEDIFSSDRLKAKNLCIITDSFFSPKLIRKKSISLTPYDLRYTEKIAEKSRNQSREVISFGDQHWPGSSKTEGLGLFTYYIQKALIENPLDVIDMENLIFEENVIFPITKIAGTKLLRGRLKGPHEKNGQFVIAKVTPAPLIDILETGVSPRKGYPGDPFTVTATTNIPASDVYIEVAGKRFPMEGQDTQWHYRVSSDKLGQTSYKIAALNQNDAEGKSSEGIIETIKKRGAVSNVTGATVSPGSGLGGDPFKFEATTDTPAKEVAVLVGGKRYKMKGAGTRWSLSQVIDKIGDVDFDIVATNEDGVEGAEKKGHLKTRPGQANVVAIETAPKAGFAGEEFTITARTDRPAASATVILGGKKYEMKGSGRIWRLKKKITDVGEEEISAVARNVDGAEGSKKSAIIVAKKAPLAIPDVAAVKVGVVSPGKGYAGDRYEVKVRTSALSDKVILEIDGVKHPMEGKGTEWRYVAKIDKVGVNNYTVSARNKDGLQGASRDGEIKTTKRPAAPIQIIQAKVSPQKGYVGKTFKFQAITDRPANDVFVVIGNKRYPMKGSGLQWSLNQKIEIPGDIDFSIVAQNKERQDSRPYSAAVKVYKSRYKLNKDGTIKDVISGKSKPRFVDNGNGTVTDLATNLMWMKQPKQIALDWEDAVEYCRDLDYKGLKGWRLPTIGELKNLTAKTKQSPALPPGHPFDNVITHVGYWSKTRHKFGPQYVYQMSMYSGKPQHLKKNENAVVWPVRYAEESD